MHKSFFEKYKNTSQNVSKPQQVILLYEGAIRLLRNAKIASLENRIEEKFNFLDKLAKIINGLSLSLDHQNGGEIALILDKFYTDLYIKIFSLHKSSNVTDYDEVEESLTSMLNAWKEVIKKEETDLVDPQTNPKFLA